MIKFLEYRDSRSKGALLTVIFILALMVKLVYLILFGFQSGDFNLSLDSQYYVDIAKEYLSIGMWSAYSINPALGMIMIGPIEPIYLMCIFTIFPDNLIFLFVINAILASFIGVFIFLIADLIGFRKAGWYAGLYIGFYKFFIGNGFFISAGKDMLMTLLMAISLYSLIFWLINRRSIWKLIVSLSIAIHLDERFLSVTLVVGIILLLRSFAIKKERAVFFIWMIGMFLLSIPWLVRNFYAHNKIVLLSPRISQFIDPLLGQNTDIDILEGESNAKSFSELELDSITQGLMTSKTYVYSGRTPETMIIPESLIEEVKRGNRPVRFSYFTQISHAARDYFLPIYWKREWTNLGFTLVLPQKKSVWITTILGYVWLLPLGFYGMFLLIQKKINRWLVIGILGFYWSYAMLNILLMPFIDNRYRWPLDGILILMAFIALQKIISKWRIVK
jgi:hypothetical protein